MNLQERIDKLFQIYNGGPNSGNFGHSGRPGLRGGSSSKPSNKTYPGFEIDNCLKEAGNAATLRMLDNTPGKTAEGSYRDYYRDWKGKAVAVLEMSPTDYIKETRELQDYSKLFLEIMEGEPRTEEYTKAMKEGARFPIPNIAFNTDGSFNSQEGRHRSIAAERNGIKKVPVVIDYFVKNPPKILSKNYTDKTEEFSNLITQILKEEK